MILVIAAALVAQLAADPALSVTPAAEESPAADTTPSAEKSSAYSRAISVLEGDSHSVVLRSDYFSSSTQLDDESDFLGATLQGKVAYSMADIFRLNLEGRVINASLGRGANTDTVLLEGYVSAHLNAADVRLGKQIVPWGRADGLNPTDNLTPRDYTVMLPFEEDQRLGVTALKVDGYLGDEYTLTAFTTPYFTPTVIPLPKDSNIYVDTRPARTLADSVAALKLNRSGGGSLDWSISYYHGYSLLPSARSLGYSGGAPVIELRYDPINVLGADFARNFGRYGVRGEVAYTWTQDSAGTDPLVTNPFIYYILGADRTFSESLNVNLQLLGINVQRYNDPYAISDPALRVLAIENAIIHRQQDPSTYGMTARISNKWLNDALEVELLVIHYFDRSNSYVRPLITYAFNDHVKGSVGAKVYRGREDTFFGGLRKNQGVFAEVRYSF